ncbi:MAG: hypothetical protein KF842_11535 [Caulobacter sp.]|nr:hypothetical protein [Caulobacter sp.]
MSTMDYAESARKPRRRGALIIMSLACLVFVGSVVIRPAQQEETHPLQAAIDPVVEAVQAAPIEEGPAETAVAAAQGAAQGAADAAQEASPIDWAMIGSALTFIFTGLGAISGLIFGWRNDRRRERLAELREHELRLEIARLRDQVAA